MRGSRISKRALENVLKGQTNGDDCTLTSTERQNEIAQDRIEPSDAASPHAAQVAGLFREHNRTLIAFLSSRLDSLAEAQEVAQEAYARLLRLEHPEQVGFLRAYLFRIASNLAVDRLRMRHVRAETPGDEAIEDCFETPAPERRVLAADQLRVVREALRELPPKTSAAFVMHIIEGRDFAIIAREMKLTERMVRYHVARALAHCRARVDAWEET